MGALALVAWLGATPVKAFGEQGAVDLRTVRYADDRGAARPTAAQRLAWEVRKRTSVVTRLEPTEVALDSPELYDSPFVYWSGDRAFPALSEEAVQGLRRLVEFGGFVVIDDASAGGEGFDRSVRRALGRAFPSASLEKLPGTHVLYRSFYLLGRPVGRVRGPAYLEGIRRGSRFAVIYSRHDLGGAWARDNLGNWKHAVTPDGEMQRERAYRLGVNLVMYALCLDYKDDQVHAPFIMRRRSGTP